MPCTFLPRSKKLPVRVAGAGHGLSEPPQRHCIENRIERRILVRPSEELLANPGKQGERVAGEYDADG